MELECEVCRNALAVTLADGTPVCGKCRDELRPVEITLREVG